MEDMCRYERRVEVQAPFPPSNSEIVKTLRPWLRALRLHRPGRYALTIREMDLDTWFRYVQELVNGSERLTQGKEMTDAMSALNEWLAVTREVTTQNMPVMFCIATGVQDVEFFRVLAPSQREIVMQAILAVNPTLQETLGNVQALAEMRLEAILNLRLGQGLSTSSASDTAANHGA